MVFKTLLFISLFLFSGCSIKNLIAKPKEISFIIPSLEVHGKVPFFSVTKDKNIIVGAFFIKESKLYGEIYVINHKSEKKDIFNCKTKSKILNAEIKYDKEALESYYFLKNKKFCYLK